MSCSAKFKSNAPRITCGKCNSSFHKKCSSVSDTDWNRFASGDFLYNCPKCKASRRSSVFGVISSNNSIVEPNSDLNELKDELNRFREDLSKINTFNNDFIASLNSVHESVSSIEKLVERFELKLKVVDEIVEENNRLKNLLNSMDKRIKVLESSGQGQVTKKEVFKATIGGVKPSENEDLSEITSRIFDGIGASINQSVIKCERLQSKDQSKSVILVSLRDRFSLDSLLNRAKSVKPTNVILGGDGSVKLFINEKLPTDCYNLLKQARKLHKHNFRFVWCSNGKVLVRKSEGDKATHIKSSSDIDRLLNVAA